MALQGPKAEDGAGEACARSARTLPFMHYADVEIAGIRAQVSRSGYTGEDGFEISVSNADAREAVEPAAVRSAGEAHGPRRARFAPARRRASASTAMSSTRPSRPSRPISSGRSRSAAAPKAASSARPACRRNWPKASPASASASSPKAAPRRATARSSPMRRAARSARSPPAASAPQSAGPSPWAMSRRNPPCPERQINLIVRGNAMPAEIVKLPFIPNRFKR